VQKSGWFKVIGLATVAGVAATGAVVARDQRKRKAYTPDEVRDRLQRRLADAAAAPRTTEETTEGAAEGTAEGTTTL
jgi:hypothetical protein